MQAAMETLQWPDGVARPKFKTRKSGVTMGENSNRKRDAIPFELWASLFADDCAILFNSRDGLITDSNYIFAQLRNFGLQIHIGRGARASKTEAMYFPPQRQAYAAADTSRFLVYGKGFVEFSESFKHLGWITHCSLTSETDICKRIKPATAAFGALRTLFGDKYLSEKVKGKESVHGPGLAHFSLWLRSFVPSRRFVSATSELPQPLCAQYFSHQHRSNYPPQHHFRKPLSPLGNLGCNAKKKRKPRITR
jgi:hypothetical protein